MKTKQLTLRLAGERFGIPKTTVCRHVARKYAKFWAGTPAFGAVLDERIEKHRMVLPIATLVWLWACNMHIYATVLTKFQKNLFCTHLVTWPCLQNFQWVLKNVLRKPLWTSAQAVLCGIAQFTEVSQIMHHPSNSTMLIMWTKLLRSQVSCSVATSNLKCK